MGQRNTSERVLQRLKLEALGIRRIRRKKGALFVSIPHVHGVSHKLKKVGDRFGCSVVLGFLCSRQASPDLCGCGYEVI